MALMTLATAKTRLGITTDAAGDTFLQNQIDMLESKIKRRTGRQLEPKTYTDDWRRPSVIMTADWPVTSVTSLTVDDEVLVEGTTYRIDNSNGMVQRLTDGEIYKEGDWDCVAKAVMVYVAGDATLDPEIAGLYDRVLGKMWSDRVAAGGTTVDIYTSRAKKITMADIGSVEYGTPTGSEASSVGMDWVAGFPLDVLDPFTDSGPRVYPDFRKVSVIA